MNQYLDEFGLRLDTYGILRKANGRPNCPNELLERVVRRKLSAGLTSIEDRLYGHLAMTLARIVLNNRAFKYQEESLRMECFSEMMTVLADCERNFDWKHGSKYYSYLFNSMYHAGIHVLEQSNRRTELAANLIQERADSFLNCGCRVCPSSAQSLEQNVRTYYLREIIPDANS